MIVLVQRIARIRHKQPAAHPEVNDHTSAIAHWYQQILGSADQRCDDTSSKIVESGDAYPATKLTLAHDDPFQRRTLKRSQATAYCLYLGKLGQRIRSSYAKRVCSRKFAVYRTGARDNIRLMWPCLTQWTSIPQRRLNRSTELGETT